MRFLLMAGIVLFVAGGGLLVNSRSSRATGYTSSRFLPKNHLLAVDDLHDPLGLELALSSSLPPKSSYAGRYLSRDVGVGQEIKSEFLRPHPEIEIQKGSEVIQWLLLGNEKSWAPLLDPNWTVDLCSGEKCPVKDASVLAVDCGSVMVRECSAILQLSPDQKKNYLAFDGKQNLKLNVSIAGQRGGTK